MKTVGITAEYNPFHNGHVYHLQQARARSGADCVLAVMSGNFTQRGEPAVCDKWTRAKSAVSAGESGADLVIELPFAFACSRASVFARGAVDCLVMAGADCISFGCEAEDPEGLRNLAETLAEDSEDIERIKAVSMQDGYSAAKAFELAVTATAGREAAKLLLAPNNILAVEYLKRILFWRKQGRQIEDLPVRRQGSGYREASEEAMIAGAGALRKMIREGEDISRFLPAEATFPSDIVIENSYLLMLEGIVLRSTPEQLKHICGVGEGMEHSIIREVRKAGSLEDLISGLTSRRYTAATVRRALTHVLMGTRWDEINRLTSRVPSAGRLLAANKAGREFMRTRSGGGFSIITNINREEERLGAEDAASFMIDERASDIYNLLQGEEIYSGSDRARSPYIE